MAGFVKIGLPWLLAASLALCTAWLGYQRYELLLLRDDLIYRDRNRQRDAEDRQRREEAAHWRGDDPLARVRLYLMRSPGAPAAGVVAWDEVAQRGVVTTSGLPPAGDGTRYALWLCDPWKSHPIFAGHVEPARDTRFDLARPIMPGSKFIVTLEQFPTPLVPTGVAVMGSD